MAAADNRQTEPSQSPAKEPWVFLEHDCETGKELLLQQPSGDTGGEMKSIRNAGDEPKSAQGQEKFLWWCYSACKGVLFHNAFRDDQRPYVLGAALSMYAGLPFLVPLVSMTPVAVHDTLQFMLTPFELCTMVVLCTAAFSCTTRFVSLAAAKASTVKTLEMGVLSFALLVTNLWILLAACFVCLCEVFNTGFMGLVNALPHEHTGHDERPLALFATMLPLSGAVLLARSLAVQMCIDVKATFRAFRLHCREMTEYWKLAYRSLEELYQKDKCFFALAAMGIVTIAMVIAEPCT